MDDRAEDLGVDRLDIETEDNQIGSTASRPESTASCAASGHLGDQERDDARLVAPGLVAAAAPTVAGAHLRAQDQRPRRAGTDRTQLGDPLGRFVVHHARVVESPVTNSAG